MEVDINDSRKNLTPKEIDPIVKRMIDDIFAPIIDRGLHRGADKLLQLLSQKGIPVAKKVAKELIENTKLYVEAFQDAMAGKETKASRLLREADLKSTIIASEVEYNKEVNVPPRVARSPEEVQQIFDALKKSTLITATCIRILTNTIVKDDGTNPEALEEIKKHLEELSTQEVKNQISLMLEEKNKSLLDESSYEILSAFRNDNLINEVMHFEIKNYWQWRYVNYTKFVL